MTLVLTNMAERYVDENGRLTIEGQKVFQALIERVIENENRLDTIDNEIISIDTRLVAGGL